MHLAVAIIYKDAVGNDLRGVPKRLCEFTFASKYAIMFSQSPFYWTISVIFFNHNVNKEWQL